MVADLCTLIKFLAISSCTSTTPTKTIRTDRFNDIGPHLCNYYYSLEAMLRFGRIMEIYSTGQKNGVDAFGYNSADSEPIWMKSGIA